MLAVNPHIRRLSTNLVQISIVILSPANFSCKPRLDSYNAWMVRDYYESTERTGRSDPL